MVAGMTRMFALPALLLLSACVVPIPIPVPEGTPGAIEVVLDEGDSCGARDLRQFVGQNGQAVASQVRIVGAGGAPVPVRVIGPDDVVTLDFNPERVNLRTDAAGNVTTVDCG